MDKKIIWKFNIIDLIILGVIFFSLVALLYKLTLGSGDETQAFEFTCICDEAPSELVYNLQTDAECIDGSAGETLGSIIWVNCDAISETTDKVKGTFILKTNGTKTKHGISVNDTVYLKGSVFPLVIGDTMFQVYVSDIK